MRVIIIATLVSLCVVSCRQASKVPDRSVSQVMDTVITRLYAKVPESEFAKIDDAYMEKFLSDDEKQVLATRYQSFNVNVPVTVSLMRHQQQAVVPFWLEVSGFVKTSMVVKNEEYTYDVWQKNFAAGSVNLGINGFDKHRPVYFISVAPQKKEDALAITDVYPGYPLDTLRVGAFTYHDWSGLTITEVPEALNGQVLFTTVRGRAREAHVIDAFRKTMYPSSSTPDQIMLTWSGSPKTSIDVQWRTLPSVSEGVVQYWKEGTVDTLVTKASVKQTQDRMLYNDRYSNHFTTLITNLTPGARYAYRVGSGDKRSWSDVRSFETEGEHVKDFTFVWFGDTHTFPDSGKLVSLADRENKDAAFYSIAGDIVSTGLNRDDWDHLYGNSNDVFSRKPLMPVPGNHDRQDGMGAQLYYDLFSLPKNAPKGVDEESSYSFEYGNALFIMIDATSDVDDHTPWIEETLANTKATWKFVMFHFPPYNFEEPYPDIQAAWVPLFDKYHVDMVMGGHVHYYMRSRPMAAGKVVDSFSKGTVYAISISIPYRHDAIAPEPYAVKQYNGEYFYQRMEIHGNTLSYKAVNSEGVLRDELVIKK